MALDIIKDGIQEYLNETYFEDMGMDNDKFWKDCEICNTLKCITFATLIANIDDLLDLQVDGRGKGKIKVLFGVGETDDTISDGAESILENYNSEVVICQ